MNGQRRIVRPDAPQDKEPDFSVAHTDLEDLLSKSMEVLRREVRNLMIESSSGKLQPTSAGALVNYVKLLKELKDEEDDLLKELSNKHLEKLANANKPK